MGLAESRTPRRSRRWLAYILAGTVVLVGLAGAAGEVAATRTREALRAQAQIGASLHAALLRSELEKQRSLPFVLAEDADVRALLTRPTEAKVADMNRKLEGLSRQTRAAVIYLIDSQGVTLAASNWRLSTSFVGARYGYRPYFSNALTHGSAEYFALGAVSRRPGLFLARRVEGSQPLGVVVVKVEFDALEAEWRRSRDMAFVTDMNGVVLIASEPAWRFRTLSPLPPERRAQLLRALQFGEAPLAPLPINFGEAGREISVRLASAPVRTFVAAETRAAATSWKLHFLTPAEPVLGTAVVAARAVALIAGALVLAAIGLLLRRRELEAARVAAHEAAQAELEDRVEARTAELRNANSRLVVEMDERRRVEANLHALQDELVQANKLAVLGQIAAGVAHEINQPVAAIRTYADSAVVLIDRDQAATARKNLSVIATLTERIGLITAELRAFARKSRDLPRPISVDDAVSGALLLVGASARRQGVRLVRDGKSRGLMAQADQVRLEQVLVNLLQNALEAVAGVTDPMVWLVVSGAEAEIRICVVDNGPGLSPEAADGLFIPFATSKPKGLGLGLVISREIVREFGGQLTFKPAPEGGAMFTVSLRRAA